MIFYSFVGVRPILKTDKKIFFKKWPFLSDSFHSKAGRFARIKLELPI